MYEHGQQLWAVPIRWWEQREPLPVTRDTSEYGPDAMVCHAPHYGHAVFFRREDVFPTREAAVTEIDRRNVERERRASLEVDQLLEAILADVAASRKDA